jgi:hypothetical protein
MGAVKHGDLVMEPHRHPRTGSFTKGRTQGVEQGFHLGPADIAGYRLGKERLESSLMMSVHLINDSRI